MIEHTITTLRAILEAKKLKKTNKVIPAGLGKPLVSNILKRARTRGLKPGRYTVSGVELHVKEDGDVHLVCSTCGLEVSSATEYKRHQLGSHDR